MKVLFLDCFSGISGDMTVSALVDLGVKPSTLEWELSKLDLGDFHMHFERQKRNTLLSFHSCFVTLPFGTPSCCSESGPYP